MATLPARPRKGKRFGGDAAHQKAMMGNLVASLIAAEAIVTTEAKAKALRPVVEKCVTKAKKATGDEDRRVDLQRQVVAFIRDKDMAHKLFAEIGPRYTDRSGGYTRILKLGPRHGDNAPMARIEFVVTRRVRSGSLAHRGRPKSGSPFSPRTPDRRHPARSRPGRPCGSVWSWPITARDSMGSPSSRDGRRWPAPWTAPWSAPCATPSS